MSTASDYLSAHDAGEIALVLAFDGLNLLVTTTGDTSGIATGWSATDWTVVKPGLRKDGLVIEQSIEAFKASIRPNNLTFTIVDTDGTLDTSFASDALSTAHTTELTQDFAPTDTTMHVLDATSFASSGTAYIGTRAYSYSGKTSTTLTGCAAKYSLFTTSSGAAYRQLHRCDSTAGSDVAFRPTVYDQPAQWYGRMVALYLAVKIDGTWTTNSTSELLWVGRLRSLHDNGDGVYLFDCESILSALQGQLLADPYRGELSGLSTSGMTSTELQLATYTDVGGTTATHLRSLTLSNPTTHEELASEVAVAVNFAMGAGSFALRDIAGVGKRYVLNYSPSGLSSQTVIANMTMHPLLWALLGFTVGKTVGIATDSSGDNLGVVEFPTFEADKTGVVRADSPPAKLVLGAPRTAATTSITLTNPRGTFRALPDSAKSDFYPAAPIGTNGFLKIGDSTYAVNNTSGDTFAILRDVTTSLYDYTVTTTPTATIDSVVVPITTGSDPVVAQQVWAEVGIVSDVFRRLLVSTGTSGFNDATTDAHGNAFDANPSSMGVALPYSIVDVNSLRALGAGRYALIVDKPTPLSDLLESILNLTATCLVWRSGKLTVRPLGADAPAGETTVSLTEANKGAQPGALPSEMRTRVAKGIDGVINRVVVHYDRDSGGNFAKQYIINNLSSQTDTGSTRTLEINALGVYDALWGAAGGNIKDYTANLAGVTGALFARPMAQLTRTYDASLWCTLYPGDRVKLTDNYVPDPRTGTRGITDRSAWVLSTSFDVSTGIGTVVLVTSPEMTPSRLALWAPSARVDDTNNTAPVSAGYDSSNLRLYILSQAYSNPHGTAADISGFSVGDAIHIRQIGATSPVEWTRTVAGINTASNYITLSSALSSPAFDSTAKYVVESDSALNASTTQLTSYTYQSSTSNNSTGKATNDYYVYSGTLTTISQAGDTPPDYQVVYRRTPTADYSTGAPMSTHKWADGFYNALNLYASVCSPVLLDDVMTSGNQLTQTGTTRKLVYGPIAVPLYDLNPLRQLKARVYGMTSAGTATFRVILSTGLVQGSSSTATSYPDGGGQYVDITTTSGTLTWTSQGTLAVPIVSTVANGPPIVWLTVEASATSSNTATFAGIELVEAPLTSGSWNGA